MHPGPAYPETISCTSPGRQDVVLSRLDDICDSYIGYRRCTAGSVEVLPAPKYTPDNKPAQQSELQKTGAYRLE